MTQPAHHQARWPAPLLFELQGLGEGLVLPESPREGGLVPGAMERAEPPLPNLTRLQAARHYVRLSQRNFGVDTGSYPLGSCTMKYNPRVSEEIAFSPGAADVHPLLPEHLSQGSLQVLYELQEQLRALLGMDAVTLQPSAGAHGEFVGLLIARAYFKDRGEARDEVVVPDSAHGTNPASAAQAGFKVIEIPSDKQGMVDIKALRAAVGPKTAAFMLTNPNTLGIFEENVEEIAQVVHDAGALLYYDGANLNAILGVTNPGAMGFDIAHLNTHKTLSTPHGGGGPGAGPVGVKAHLKDFLPIPLAGRRPDGSYFLDDSLPKTIGRVRSYHGSFGVLLRAHTYILLHGSDGLAMNTRKAVLNANYVKQKILGPWELPGKQLRKHEFVVSGRKLKQEKGIRTMDVAKRLLDYGIHAPTVYFPHIVEEALMIEPTESESKEELDRLVEALLSIAREDPELVRSAPHHLSVQRVDEVAAARKPVLRWAPG
ncbi:MAG TPA: aminomethyl-transferring glycine dehydrogenase subunit GcvPB [Candidatus Thermoplasmatota archaeon]|jgi:glycine dehydrogenase subunit 2|nr:aminomethyl-transferring glycine dehydrogenase subunit GcvPB [Candidatus Thermoplasmatota archaeon]